MNSFYEKAYEQLETKLSVLELEIDDDVVLKSESAIKESINAIESIKTFFKEHVPINEAEEILFFKTIKPKFVSKLIYYLKVYNIESHCPNGSKRTRQKYYELELKKLKYFFDHNLEFYRYYRRNSNYLDYKYFVRGRLDLKLKLDSHFFEYDKEFSTSHDYTVSKIIANDLLLVYLEDELTKIELNDKSIRKIIHSKINWTASKVALIELIYALDTAKTIDNGKADIKDIARVVQRIFKIDLGDYYRSYLEIRMRKTGRTKFLDSLKEQLIERMNESDEGR